MLQAGPATIAQGSTNAATGDSASEASRNEAVALSSSCAGRILAAMAAPQAVPEGKVAQLGALSGMPAAAGGLHAYVSASSPQLKSSAAPSRGSPVLSPAPTAPGSPAASAGSSRYIGASGLASREGSDVFRNSTPTSRQPRYQILRRRTSPPRTVKDFSEITGFTGGSSVSSPLPTARSPRGPVDGFKASSNAGSPQVLMRTLDGRTFPVAPASSPSFQRDLQVGQVSRFASVPDSAEMQRMQSRIEELEGELERRLAEVAEQENRISILTRRNEELEEQYKLIQTEELEERMEMKKTFQEAELTEPLPQLLGRRESTPGAMAAAAVAAVASASLGVFAKGSSASGDPGNQVGPTLSGTLPEVNSQSPDQVPPESTSPAEDLEAPILQEAERALQLLNANLISEIKVMKKPAASIRMVLSAVCVLRGIKPARVKDETGRMVDDYWPSAVKMMSDIGFLQSLVHFDRDHIPPAIMQKVSAFTSKEDFTPDRVRRTSAAAAMLCRWVLAVEAYDQIARRLASQQEPPRERQDMTQSRGSADDGPLRRLEKVAPPTAPPELSKEASPSEYDPQQSMYSPDEYAQPLRPAAPDAGDEEYSYVEEEYTEDYAELQGSGGLMPQAVAGSGPAGGALRRPATTAPQRPSAKAQPPRKATSVGPRSTQRLGGVPAESTPARGAPRAKAVAAPPVDGAAQAAGEVAEGDEIDSAIRRNMQAIAPVYRNVELSKIRKNWYQFGPPVDKKVFIKQVAKDKVAVRVGTNFLPLDKFIADNRTR